MNIINLIRKYSPLLLFFGMLACCVIGILRFEYQMLLSYAVIVCLSCMGLG